MVAHDRVRRGSASRAGHGPVAHARGPAGRRIPDYPLEITDAEIGALYRDMVLVRRFDAEATALQRQGELGLWASLPGPGGGPDRGRPRRASAGHDLPDLPRARRRLVPRHRPAVAAAAVPRHHASAASMPAEANFNMYTIVIGAQTLHAAGYAMGVVRDGAVGTGDPTATPPCWPSSATAPRARATSTRASSGPRPRTCRMVYICQNNQWAISAPVTTQSRVPLYQRAAGFGFPRRAGRRQRRARLPGGHPQGARRGPQRPGADADRGVHLPDGPAHQLRRPDPLPARRPRSRPGS